MWQGLTSALKYAADRSDQELRNSVTRSTEQRAQRRFDEELTDTGRQRAREDEAMGWKRQDRERVMAEEGILDAMREADRFGSLSPDGLKAFNSRGRFRVDSITRDDATGAQVWNMTDGTRRVIPYERIRESLYGENAAEEKRRAAEETRRQENHVEDQQTRATERAWAVEDRGLRMEDRAETRQDRQRRRGMEDEDRTMRLEDRQRQQTLEDEDRARSALREADQYADEQETRALRRAEAGRRETQFGWEEQDRTKGKTADKLKAAEMLGEMDDNGEPVYQGALRQALMTVAGVPAEDAEITPAEVRQQARKKAPKYWEKYQAYSEGRGLNLEGLSDRERRKLDRLWVEQGMPEELLDMAPHRAGAEAGAGSAAPAEGTGAPGVARSALREADAQARADGGQTGETPADERARLAVERLLGR